MVENRVVSCTIFRRTVSSALLYSPTLSYHVLREICSLILVSFTSALFETWQELETTSPNSVSNLAVRLAMLSTLSFDF